MMTPTEIGKFRAQKIKPHMNWKQVFCTGPCKQRKSIGQFTHRADVCDACVKRMPKAA